MRSLVRPELVSAAGRWSSLHLACSAGCRECPRRDAPRDCLTAADGRVVTVCRFPASYRVHSRVQVRWATCMSVTQRNAAVPRWLPLAAAALGTVVAASGPLSGTSTRAASSGVNGNALAWCMGAITRVDNTGSGLSGGPPVMLPASIAAWPACDAHARYGSALSVSELKPMTPLVVLPQRAQLTASAAIPGQPALAAVAELSSQSTTTYSVRFGDCLSDIATNHTIADWQQLYAVNRRGISNPDLIYPGQLLRLPVTQARSDHSQIRHRLVGPQR